MQHKTHISTSEIEKLIPPGLTRKEYKRAFWHAKNALRKKQRDIEILQLEIQRLEMYEEKKNLVNKRDALLMEQHVAKERSKLGLT